MNSRSRKRASNYDSRAPCADSLFLSFSLLTFFAYTSFGSAGFSVGVESCVGSLLLSKRVSDIRNSALVVCFCSHRNFEAPEHIYRYF